MTHNYLTPADIDGGLMLEKLTAEIADMHSDIVLRAENGDERTITLKIKLQPGELIDNRARKVRLQYEIGSKLPGPQREKFQGGADLLTDGKGFLSAEQHDLFEGR